MRQLIAALGDDIKASGRHWMAKCPVHKDKDFAMKISQRSDLSVGAHCFSCGANGLDLYKTLGLDLDELFGGRQLEKREKPMMPHDISREYKVDKLCVSFHEADLELGKQTTLIDKRRYRFAIARIKGVEDKFYH